MTTSSRPCGPAAPAVAVDPVRIGEAARLTGLSAKRIRHYEEDGLLPDTGRSQAGYRLYGEADLHRLRFIARARDLGFPMQQIATLLGLWDDRDRASADVKTLALAHADALAAKIAELEAMRRTLQDLAARCHGDERPDCPILDGLDEGAGARPRRQSV